LLWTHGQAWLFSDGKWRRTESASAGMEARIICEIDEIESARLIATLERMVPERERKD
jgi:hypothetical protein